MELHGAAVTPQVAVAVFESWAAMGAVPMRSRAFGLAVRQHLRIAAFAPQVRRLAGCGCMESDCRQRDTAAVLARSALALARPAAPPARPPICSPTHPPTCPAGAVPPACRHGRHPPRRA